ncbi:cytochrome c oxidase assembly protein [Labedaea rhizosphaerae]|uniref:Putative copper resistance protein D n=1 Tax=Labedaea rhizosphaerae TaxID=598644 RepID=A0A4R6SAA1_LABRH|nr:cytochrome c oxidase assembly protein [Labedaea rhizosphaerae]TDP96423.1 putative copper resistance protein D [Labedaea rhizosphaerae]
MAPMLLVGGLLAAVLAAGLLALTGGNRYVLQGLSDPGLLTEHGLIVVRVLTEVACVLCVGSLLFAAFLVPPQRSGTLDVDGYAAMRTAGISAVVWFVGSLLMVPFTIADSIGEPVTSVFHLSELSDLMDALPLAKAWFITAIVVLIVLVGTRFALSWGWTATLFFVAVFGVVPIAVTGHSSAGGAHDLATDSLLLHLVGAALWVGGLVALLAHGRRRGAHLGLAARRFSKVALVCWIVMAVSGVVNAAVRVPAAALFTTSYGLLIVAKVVALVVLGAIGYLHRERTIPKLGTGSGPLVRLAAVEMLLMFVTLAIASALARTPPPPQAVLNPNSVELELGYPLDGPPTVGRILFDWRFDLIFGTAAILLAVCYLLGVRRLRKRGDSWPVGRTIAWVCGCLTILVATSSGIGRYSPAMFSMHMSSHMLLSMLAPVLLVLGGPVTLALRALPTAGRGAPGPREWLVAAVHSPLARALTHPVVALALFVGSFYGLYMSGLFDESLDQHWAHLLMYLHFLLSGYVFYWPVIGVDPSPRRLPYIGRLALVFASLPFHAFFGVILMSMQSVIGLQFYRGLGLPWVHDLLADQRLGGGIAWASGELPLIVVIIALLSQWARADEREARRSDRKADSDGDAELEAYNAMLRKLAGRDT